MYYISQSTKNIPWNCAFTVRNSANVWILIIGIKETTKVQKVLVALSIQKFTGKYNIIHAITVFRDKNIVRKKPIK